MALNVESVCRICLLGSEELKNIFELPFEGSIEPIETRIKQISGVEIEPISSHLIYICQTCIEDLLAALRFRLNIIRSTELLRSCVDKTSDDPHTDHTLLVAKEEYLDNDHEDETGNDFTEEVETVVECYAEEVQTPTKEPAQKARRRKRNTDGEIAEKPKQNIICEICGSVYNNKAALWTHKKRHDGVRKYKCELCSMAFIDKSILKGHMRTHTQEKRFSCATCGRKFGTLCSTKRHERIHTGERPYPCTFQDCSKSFTLAHGLARHILIHTGQKPYECKVCGDKFKQSQHLKTHQNIHLRESGKPYTKYVRPAKRRKTAKGDTETVDKHVKLEEATTENG